MSKQRQTFFILINIILTICCPQNVCQVSPQNLKYGAACKTTTNQNGKCISINSCPNVLKILLDIQQDPRQLNETLSGQLKQTQCGNNQNIPYVCCPTNEIHIYSKILEYFNGLECGIGTRFKVAHGDQANILAYRWMALLKYENELEPIFQCGGSLISNRYVLSAAHCFISSKNKPVEVRLGEYDLRSENDCTSRRKTKICIPKYVDIKIENILIPDNYERKGLYHDIALIRLEQKVEFGGGIRPVCLPISEELQYNQPDWYTVAGWGRTETENTSSILLEATIPTQTLEFCKLNLDTSEYGSLNIGHICAGGAQLKDTCKGDSGGPLFSTSLYTDGVVRTIQYGIVSLGVVRCGQRDVPAIYTNVSHYMPWILDHMKLDF